MTAKGLLGWGMAGLIGLGSLFGAPLADSLVKEGKLPEWLSIKIAGWLASEIVIPSLSLVPILLCIGVAVALLIKFLPRTNSDEADRLARTSVLLADTNRRCIELDHDKVRLEAANANLNATTNELNKAKLELDAARSGLNAANAKIADLQTPKVQPLTESHHIVLAGIMIYDNADKPCYVKDLSQKINFTMVQAEGAVDVLVKRRLVDEYYTNGGRGVSLSADGRAYVLHPDFDMSHLPL
jgi:hypothetical protein